MGSRNSCAGRGAAACCAQFGCNPNSSSLGGDVAFLRFGALFASAFAVVPGALRSRSKSPAKPAVDHRYVCANNRLPGGMDKSAREPTFSFDLFAASAITRISGAK